MANFAGLQNLPRTLQCLLKIHLMQLCVKQAIRLILLNKIGVVIIFFELSGFRMSFERF